MTVYSIKIPFKSESDTARLRAVIEADLAACETIEVHDDGKDIVGYFVRQEEWETDVILVTSETEKYLTVEVGAPCDRAPEAIAEHVPPLVGALFREKQFPIRPEYLTSLGEPIPMNLSAHFRDKCIEMMRGNGQGALPMVYVSRLSTREGNGFVVDPRCLAETCVGLACVVTGETGSAAYALKEQTNSRNVFNGYIAVYLPHTEKYTVVKRKDGETEESICFRVFDIVRKWHISSASENEYSRSRLLTLRDGDEARQLRSSLERDIDAAAAANRELEQTLEALQTEIDRLKQENYQFQMRCDSMSAGKNKEAEQGLLTSCGVRQAHPEEEHDLIVAAVTLYEKNALSGTRAKKLAAAVLEKNPYRNKEKYGKEMYEDLRRIFKESPEINAAAESELRKWDFVLERNAGHNQLVYTVTGDTFTMSCSPGSQNVAEKRVKEIRGRISVYRQ